MFLKIKPVDEETVQKSAWRIVRSAEDRMGAGRGSEKLIWCVQRLSSEFKILNVDRIEDHVRAAHIQFKMEKEMMKEGKTQ